MNILMQEIISTILRILEYPILPKTGITVGSYAASTAASMWQMPGGISADQGAHGCEARGALS